MHIVSYIHFAFHLHPHVRRRFTTLANIRAQLMYIPATHSIALHMFTHTSARIYKQGCRSQTTGSFDYISLLLTLPAGSADVNRTDISGAIPVTAFHSHISLYAPLTPGIIEKCCEALVT